MLVAEVAFVVAVTVCQSDLIAAAAAGGGSLLFVVFEVVAVV